MAFLELSNDIYSLHPKTLSHFSSSFFMSMFKWMAMMNLKTYI